MCTHTHTHSSDGNGSSVITTTTGKRPSDGCHGKYGLLSPATTLPPHPLPSFLFSLLFVPFSFFSPHLLFPLNSHFALPSFLPSFVSSFIRLFSLPLFSVPPPSFPSCHSGLPTGSRQALNDKQNKRPSVHHGMCSGQRLGQQRDTPAQQSRITGER